MSDGPAALLRRAADVAGVDASSPVALGPAAALLPGGVVAVIAASGGAVAAARHRAAVSRWLEDEGVPATRLARLPDGAASPVEVAGGAVTFWRTLPAHRRGRHHEVAPALRRLHGLGIPSSPPLGPVDPFRNVEERVRTSPLVAGAARDALLTRLARAREAWADLPPGLPHSPLHGDAWAGNVVTLLAGDEEFAPGTVVLRDLERVSVGPPEWDLVATALSRTTLGELDEEQYREFSRLYGHDVRAWAGYPVMRDARELRMVAYALAAAEDDHAVEDQARARVRDCLRGERPWPRWRAL